MAKFTIVCDGCKEIFTGQDEYEAELKWNNHECPADEELKGLSLKELRALAMKDLSK